MTKMIDQGSVQEALAFIREVGNRLDLLWVTAVYFNEDGALRLVAGISKKRPVPDGEEKFVLMQVHGTGSDDVQAVEPSEGCVLMHHKVIACCMRAMDGAIAYAYVNESGEVYVCPYQGCDPTEHFRIEAEPRELFMCPRGTLIIIDAHGEALEPLDRPHARVGASGTVYESEPRRGFTV